MATEDDVRRVVAALPETSEVSSAGVPYFRVARHGFAKLRQEPEALVVFTADLAAKQALIDSAPDKFFSSEHYAGVAAVLVRLDAVDVEELVDLLVMSWRLRAPEDLRAGYDRAVGAGSGIR
jgi:hypothetical protein